LVTDQNKNSSKHKSLESINNSTPMPAKPWFIFHKKQ
jgi:hypothetical protein